MANKIELTAEQLSHLDMVIAEKKSSDKFFIEVAEVCTVLLVAHIPNVPEAVIAAVAAVEDVNGAASIHTLDNAQLLEIGKNISLDQLLEIRNNSILKQ